MRAVTLITLSFGLSACATAVEKPVRDNSVTLTGKILNVEKVAVMKSGHNLTDELGNWLTTEQTVSTLQTDADQSIRFLGKCEGMPEHPFSRSVENVTVMLVAKNTGYGNQKTDNPVFALENCKVR